MDNMTFLQSLLMEKIVPGIIEIIKMIVQGLVDHLSWKKGDKTGYIGYNLE